MSEKFNISNRIIMFSICSSIEFDLREYISKKNIGIEFNDVVAEKIDNRKKGIKIDDYTSNNVKALELLDLGDLVEIIISNSRGFNFNSSDKKEIKEIFDLIIPIRNKVMHTRPIDFSDRGILQEAMDTIDKRITTIEWNKLKLTRGLLKDDPQQLLKAVDTHYIIDDSTNVFHNLPTPEFDDTGYIGRKKEIKEVTDLIISDNNQIITIVGNGGIGKTATVVNCLYNLIDSGNEKYEAILWTSLKTKTLSNGEFVNIKDGIDSLEKMYKDLNTLVVNENMDAVDTIIEFMSNFRTLLVVDNLETIPTEKIIGFLKKIPAQSKVLITSRTGLGELEYRYKLNGMEKKDSRNYFRTLSKYYQLELHKKSDSDLDKLIKDKLYSSPLSIKWYITSLFYGAAESSVLANKINLVDFSMSNIVEKLTNVELKILWLFLIEGKNLSYGEIDYFLYDKENDQRLISGIMKLTSTSMINLNEDNMYAINAMAKDYLKKNNQPDNKFFIEITKERTSLNSKLQEINVKNNVDPYNPKSLSNSLKDETTKIASFYLMKALDASWKRSWELAYQYINRAERIAPDYFEVYKIKAFINAENGNLSDAVDAYRIALENTENSRERASIYLMYSMFYTLKMSDALNAKTYIDYAIELEPNEAMLLLEKSRVYASLGNFSIAKESLEKIDLESINTEKFENQFVTRKCQLILKECATLDNREHENKARKLCDGITAINRMKYKTDNTTYVALLELLIQLSYNLVAEEFIDIFITTIKNNIGYLKSNTSNKKRKLADRLYACKNRLPMEFSKFAEDLNLGRKSHKIHKSDVNRILDKKEGIIVKLEQSYGFIQNADTSYYFSTSDILYMNAKIGDLVKIGRIMNNPKGNVAKAIRKIERE